MGDLSSRIRRSKVQFNLGERLEVSQQLCDQALVSSSRSFGSQLLYQACLDGARAGSTDKNNQTLGCSRVFDGRAHAKAQQRDWF